MITFNPIATPTRTLLERVFGKPVREIGDNLLRVHNTNDIAQVTDFPGNRFEGGSNHMEDYDVSGQLDAVTENGSVRLLIDGWNRAMAHSMEEAAAYWDKEYARFSKREIERAQANCSEEQ